MAWIEMPSHLGWAILTVTLVGGVFTATICYILYGMKVANFPSIDKDAPLAGWIGRIALASLGAFQPTLLVYFLLCALH